MNFDIYWLISEDKKRTYIGYSNNLKKRLKEHKNGQVRTTKEFGNFCCYRLEKCFNIAEARKREKYWKSSVGRKRLKVYFNSLS